PRLRRTGPCGRRQSPPLPWRGGGRRRAAAARRRRRTRCPGAATLVVGVIALGQDYHDLHGEMPQQNMAATGAADTAGVAAGDWSAYGHSGHGDRYAPAAQITPANAGRLTQAWSYHTGDFKGPTDPGEIANEVTPIKVNGMLYMCTPHNIVIALNPDTGKEIWRHDPKINRDAAGYQHMICRGVAYWDANAPSPAGTPRADAATMECPRRILAPTMDGTLIAVNADTGATCKSFGDNGVIDLYKGHPVKRRGMLMPTSPPAVAHNMIVMAASVTDNESTDEPSGVIRGYDPVSGKLVWNWDPARPDETNPLTAGETYVRNSPNSWGVSSIDDKLGMVYIPMGNETPDTWGGRRNKNGERFNSAIVALDLATGKLKWVYQTVHHDIWDMDIGGQPTLVDIDTPKGRVPSLVATTKTGNIFVIDRRDGSLVVPAPEKPVP
ncbi:MAG: membrane-bound PQQ-dependent dehydrogenase, glucose/quinate/shikimate family, partial [Brevundimonas sp.]